MSDNSSQSDRIIDSWRKNAVPWTNAVRQQQIESRRLVTDRAILEAILDYSPNSVLDLGCGEGWLVRYLIKKNIKAIGIDAVSNLIAEAKQLGIGDFRVASYEEIIEGKLSIPFDINILVCNLAA